MASHTPDYYLREYGSDQVPLSLGALQLEPADRAVLKIADERDAVQKKTFTKWINKHLLKAGRRVIDLFEDLRDGHNLISLLEVLAHDTLPREKGRMKFHKIQNVQIALEYLSKKGIRLVNIRSDEIVDGNPKLTLGLIWTIILHFQISDVVVSGQEDLSAKEALLLWSRRTVEGYPGVKVKNFTSSWRDGRAFLSIIHRHRPDLVDFRKVQMRTARQNLEQAFSVAEQEFGVTRLLDPEDVDVPEPDEKSVITYISSLYDVFPDVPSVEETLRDNERQLKIDEYRDLASSLITWLQQTIMMMKEQKLPSTLIEMKTLQAECNKFKIEEVPPRLEMKKRLFHIYDEIQGFQGGTAYLNIPEEIRPDSMNRFWERFILQQQERDNYIQSEIIRLERLQRLAEKIHRDCKHCEDSLEDIGPRIREEQTRVDKIHPLEAKRNCDAIDRALQNVEEMVRSSFRDIQMLQEGRFATGDQLYRRASSIQSRVSELRTLLFSEVIQKLISKSYVEETSTLTKKKEIVTEIRLIETNPVFQHVQECLNWIESRQKSLENAEYGGDLDTVQSLAEEHDQLHQEVQGFRREVERCISEGKSLPSEEKKLYTQWLSKMEVAYSLLVNTSTRRHKCLESLHEFLQSATQELLWLNEREELELSRDWSSPDADMDQTDSAYKTILRELEARETQFNSVQDRGSAMVLDRHPASESIRAYMEAMQSQWSWLIQLTVCLEQHVKFKALYHQFFKDCKACEEDMDRQQEMLSSRYSQEHLDPDEAKQRVKELQELQKHLTSLQHQVEGLIHRSGEVPPLQLRSSKVQSPVRVQCLCTYRQPELLLEKGMDCLLLDNSDGVRWTIRNSSGQEGRVPAACFVIPPPNHNAIQTAQSLKSKLENLLGKWKLQYRTMRYNMVLATMHKMKSWDLKQFMLLDPSRREAFWKTLNDDTNSLMREVGESSPEMRKLREELANCNQIFLSLSASAMEYEINENQSPEVTLLQDLDALSHGLKSCDQSHVSLETAVWDRSSIRHALEQHRAWERMFRTYEGDLERVRKVYATLPRRSHSLEVKYAEVMQKWDQMLATAEANNERLRAVDSVLSGVDSMKPVIADFEIALVSQDTMTSDPMSLQQLREELLDLNKSTQKHQPVIAKLQTEMTSLASRESSSQSHTPYNINLLEEEVTAIKQRWDNVCRQVSERLQSTEVAGDMLLKYTTGIRGEQTFVSEMQRAKDRQPPLSYEVEELKTCIEPTMAIYNSLGEEQYQIEAVNKHGGQFIREAKIYDRRLKQYRSSLEDIDAALIQGINKRFKRQDGAEVIKIELDELNRQYISLIQWTKDRLREITRRLSEANVNIQFQMVIDDDIPLLRTFRSELAKRSSVLMDEDMQGFFEELSDYEGYTGTPGQFYGVTPRQFTAKATATMTFQRPEVPEPFSRIKVTKMETVPDKPVQRPLEVHVKSRAMTSLPEQQKRLSLKLASMTGVKAPQTAQEMGRKRPKVSQTLLTVKQESVAPTSPFLHIPGVLNTKTNMKMTLREALQTGLFDPKTGCYCDPRSQRKLSYSEACQSGLITRELREELAKSSGMLNVLTGRPFTVLESIQKGLFDPVQGTMRDHSTGRHVDVHQAAAQNVIPMEVAERMIGPEVSVTTIAQSQAIFGEGSLEMVDVPLSLAEMVEKDFYNSATGKLQDPISGAQLTIIDAVEKEYVNPSKREIKDAASNEYVTIVEAVGKSLLDPEAGLFIIKSEQVKLQLDEAYERQILNRPLTLPRMVRDGLLSDRGQVTNPRTGEVMSFSDALDIGLIDDNVKCVVNPRTNDILSVSEAIEQGFLDSRGLFVPPGAAPAVAISEALVQGYLKLVEEEVVFPKPCVLDTRKGIKVTVPEALRHNLITSSGEYVDTSSNRRILLGAAGSQGLVHKDMVEKLTRETSLKDATNKNISFMRAIQIGMVDVKKGQLCDFKTGDMMDLQNAVTEGLISSEDAECLMEVLSSAVTHTTVITKVQPSSEEPNIEPMTVSEAKQQGLINEYTGEFRIPNTGATMPIDEAIEKGYLIPDIEEENEYIVEEMDDQPMEELDEEARWLKEVSLKHAQLSPGASATDSKLMRKGDTGFSFTTTTVSRPVVSESVVTETRHLAVQSALDPRTKERISAQEAVKRGLLDMRRGHFTHPTTGKKLTIVEAINQGFLTGKEVDEVDAQEGSAISDVKSFSITGVVHPRTNQKITVSQATKEGILHCDKGLYIGRDAFGREKPMKISEAVTAGLIFADTVMEDAPSTAELIRETKQYTIKRVVHPHTKRHVPVIEAVREGIIDEHNGIYHDFRTGEKLTIIEAIERKLIEAELTSVSSNTEGGGNKIITTKLTTLMVSWVVDPRTGETIPISKAIEEGIIDQHKGCYHNLVTGETISMNDAIERKLAIAKSSTQDSSDSGSIHSIHITDEQESFEATLVEDIHSETVTFSISSVIDPQTMEMISYDDAVEKYILDIAKGVYRNPATGEEIPINEALNKGLIHADITGKKREEELMRSAFVAEKIDFPLKNVTTVRDPKTGMEMSAIRAIQFGLVDLEDGMFLDTRTAKRIPLKSALRQGFITLSKTTDPAEIERLQNESSDSIQPPKFSENGLSPSVVDMKLEKSGTRESKTSVSTCADEVLNYTTDIEQSMDASFNDDSLDGRVVFEFSDKLQMGRGAQGIGIETLSFPKGFSYTEAVKIGLVDPTSGKVRDPTTHKLISLQEAMMSGIINPKKPALVTKTGDHQLTLQDCIKEGYIDPKTGKLNFGKCGEEEIVVSPHFTSHFSKPGPLNLLDAVRANLFDEITFTFLEPLSGNRFTLQEALNRNVIDGNFVTVENSETGRRLSLKTALRQGWIDGSTANVKDFASKTTISLVEAVDRGLIANAIDEVSGTLYDSISGKEIPLEKALTTGQVKKDDVMVLDKRTGDLVTLETAFKKGLIQRNSGVVLNTATGEKMKPQDAIKMGLLAVVGAPVLGGMALYDAISKNLSQPEAVSTPKSTMDRHRKPSQMAEEHLEIRGPKTNGHPETQMIGHSERVAMKTEKMSPQTTVVLAKPGDNIQPSQPSWTPEKKDDSFNRSNLGHLVDSCDKLIQDLNNELNWLSDTEQLLRDDQPISDEAYKVKSQLEAQRAFHNDIQKHQQPILALVYQTEQLLEHHQEELTPEQVTQLQQLADNLKSNMSKVQKTSEIRLKHLTTASDEVTKFEEELTKFDEWLEQSTKELDRQEELIRDLDNFSRVMEQQKALMNDIISHQADTRFMTMSVQKYMEEAKLHKLEVDAFKANRKKTSRLSWIGMEGMDAEMVGNKLRAEVAKYDDLSSQCADFGEKLGNLNTKQREFNDNTFKLLSWLTATEEKLSTSKQESNTTDPDILREQLDLMKSLGSDALSQGVHLEELEKLAKELVSDLRNLDVIPAHITKFQEIIQDIEDRHKEVTKEINERSNSLQTALTKSQDVEDALDNLLVWLRDTESALDNQRPVSLSRDNLNEQYQEIKLIQSDIVSHKPSIEAMKHDAHELIKTCELDMAKSLESKLEDLDDKFSNVNKKCQNRNKDMDEISETLSNFQETMDNCKQWLGRNSEELESREWGKKSSEDTKEKIEDLTKQRKSKEKVVEELTQLGQLLIEDPRTGEVSAVKESLADLQRHWTDFLEILEERQQETQEKEKQRNEYTDSKKAIVEWLTKMENTVDGFEPVAVDIEVAEKQIEELEPLLEEYQEYGPILEDVNDAGFAFDATQSEGSRPQSPFRRMMRGRRYQGLLSPRLGSTSPTFPYPSSPTNILSPSSDSSGISSKKSSFDNFQLDDLSEIQQELVDINQRYDILGERLADRHQELRNIVESMKSYLQNMQELLTWIDLKELDLNIQGGLPTSEREAKKQLKEHQEFHAELLGKENLVSDIRNKGQELLKTKQGVPGLEVCHQQLSELDNKWLDIKVLSEQRRKSLEEMVKNISAFKDAGVHLQKWIAQKEKMMAVLGPISTEKEMNQNQVEQVKLLTEEFKGQAPLYEKFIQSGHTILDLCESDTKDASHISEKMDIISKDWSRLESRLQERGKALKSVEGLSLEFNDIMKTVQDWVDDFSDRVGSITPGMLSPEDREAYLQELQALDSELNNQKLLAQKTKDLHKKLCDVTKDPSTKTELKHRIANLEKQLSDAEKQIGAKRAAVVKTSSEGQELTDKCHDMLDWLSDIRSRQDQQQPVSGNLDILKEQAQQQRILHKDLIDHEPEIKDLLQRCEGLLQSIPPCKETQDLEDTAEEIRAEFEELKLTALEHDQKLEASIKHAQCFQDMLDKQLLWLQFSQDKLEGFQTTELQRDVIAKKLSDAQSLKAEVSANAPELQKLQTEGETLADLVEQDGDIAKEAIQKVSEKWRGLDQGVTDRVKSLEDLMQKLDDFQYNMKDYRSNLAKCEDSLTSHSKMGPTAKDPKHADKIKSLQDEVDGLAPQMDYLEAVIEDLSNTGHGTRDLERDLQNQKQKQENLQSDITDLLTELDEGNQVVSEFKDELSSLGTSLSGLEADFGSIGPAKRDENGLRAQLREAEEFLSQLNSLEDRIADTEEKGKNLESSGFITDPQQVEVPVDALKTQFGKLKSKAEASRKDIEDMLDLLDRVTDDLRRTRTSIDRAADELDMHEPVGTDVAAIKRQQEELQMFEGSVLEPLQKRVEDGSSKAENLIQTAAPGVNTEQLEQELESLNDKWTDLKKKVSDRKHNLENNLLQAGKFHDALDQLLVWLKDTEEMIANQKSPSPDYKICKTQLQEQKFLMTMLEDRSPSVKSAKNSAESLMRGLNPQEQKGIQNQVAQLERRWEAVCSTSRDRLDVLEEMLGLSKDFQDLHEPLTAWLESAEKKFASLEPSAMDTEGIENIVVSLKDMEKEILSKADEVKDLALRGKDLQDFCKGNDVKAVQKKIDSVQARFTELREKVLDSTEQMEEALPLAKNFNEAHADFLDWVLKTESQLRTKEATGQEAEEQVQKFMEKLQDIQPVLEVLREDGGSLADLAPGDAGLKVEETMKKDLQRYDAVSDQIQRRSQKVSKSKQRSSEIVGNITDLLDWFDDKEKILTNSPPISTELDTLDKQLADAKVLNEEIAEEKGNARDVITRGKKMMRESSLEHDPRLREAVEDLKNKSDLVWKMGQERQRTLEQAFPLAKHFWETNKDLSDWLAEAAVIVSDLKVMSIDAEQVKKQQEQVKVLKQEVQDHKPDIDRLNKTGSALIKMCGERESTQVQKIIDDQNTKMEDVKNYLKDRSLSIDEALQQSAEFTDKLEDILETLTSTHEMVENAEPISAHADKIKDQLAEVKAFMEDVDSRQAALASIKNKAEELIRQAGDKEDTAVQDVKTKLSELTDLYDNICQLSTARSKDLEDTLEVSEKFWEDYNNLCTTVKDLQDQITSQEPPALEPAIIREQQDLLETLKEEIEATQVDLDDFNMTGEQLMTMVGEPERPEVQKNMEDVTSQVGSVTEKYEQRARTLEAALEKAVHFQDELMKILVWLQKREVRLREFTPVGSDFDTIKVQWNQVKELKTEVEPKQVDIESLNQKGQEMAKDAQSSDQMVVKEPLSSVNRRWDNLLEGIGERQRNLQMAMLNVGQFEHALNELLAWLDKTDETLDDMSSSFGEPKQIELELAKLKVIQNDVDAHRDSVDSVKEAGKRVLATEHGGDTAIKRKLGDVDELWEKVQKKSANKFKQMKDALREAKTFTGELQDLLLHISDLEGNLISSNQIGGLPETAKEQLERFMNLYEELNETDPKVQKTVADGENLISKSKDISANHIKQNMELLQNRWQNIKMRAADKKKKLEDALKQADNFHEDLNSFIQWLTETEKTLNNLEPVSRLLEHVTQQIEDQKVLQKDISHNREKMIALDKTGTHLKYFSQKQDVILIRNLLSSIQHRWEKIVSRSAERTRHLERGYKEAKQFFVMWKDMMEWMQQAETLLDADTSVSNDHATIKAQIVKHREFQRSLGAKQPIYDSVNRMGRSVKDKSPEPDRPQIEKRLGTMKAKWNSLCAKSVDRQRKLEEALLFAGQFSEALQALLDWLSKVEPTLGEDQPVYGDIFTVNNLMEIHKAFQHELGARSNTVAFVRKRAKEMLDKSEHDTTQQQAELIELTTMWDRMCKLSVNKQEKLEQAHKLAEDFHQKGQALLDWLSSAERQLRYRGALPEEELPLLKQIEEHKKFEEDLMRQEAKLRETLSIGQDILKRCHPDALTTLKHWLSVLRARWEEVTAMCKQRGIKLAEGLQTMRQNNAILDDLLAWLNGAEATLMGLDQEPIPGDIQVIMDLLKDHQDFQNDMSSKQPDVDKLTKGDRRRGTSVSEPVSQIPVLKASPSGRHTPIRTPRKDPSGRKTPEPVFRNPRVGALFMKWRTVWLMAMDRHRKLQDALDYLKEVERLKDFKFDDWRRRYLQFMRHNKSRIMDMFRRQDQDRDGRVTRKEFIDGITATKFPTSQLEMETVANMFDRDGSGLIDYKDFVNALKPDREPQKPITDAEKITDEVKNQVSKCTCVKQFKIHKIGEGKYRFGDSQKLRLVRILRSTVMVRVGGGWVALDEFLVKNDPCRAKGRTNVELREQFILAQGVSQSMSPFVSKSPSGSSHSGSSTYSGASWSTRSPSSATGPITKVREKTVHSTPWRQNGGRLTPGPDGEVRQIMSHTGVDGTPKRPRHIPSPRNVFSPAVPGSGRSSRASTGGGSRPPSRADSECSEISEPEMYTTVQHETKSAGGRKQTVVTYQTHVVKTKTVGTPSSAKGSKIPKPSSARKK